MSMWNDEREVASLTDVPEWIEQDITFSDIAAICHGGCDSGAYMPAVTYDEARKTMGEHGDGVLQYIQDDYGELPPPRNDESWSGIAVHYLSIAVELWASEIESRYDDGEFDAEENDNDKS